MPFEGQRLGLCCRTHLAVNMTLMSALWEQVRTGVLGHQESLAPCKISVVERQVSANQRPVAAVSWLPGSRPYLTLTVDLSFRANDRFRACPPTGAVGQNLPLSPYPRTAGPQRAGVICHPEE